MEVLSEQTTVAARETDNGVNGIAYEYRAANHSGSHAYLYPVVRDALVGLPAGTRVLDLGCGNGSFLSLFRGRGWELFGSDFATAGVAIARRSFPDIQFVLADATRQPWEQWFVEQAGSFDAIISTEVIEHVYDSRGFLKNAQALLKPGGRLVISTPYHGYLKNVFLAVSGKMDSHFTALRHHGHIKFWSRKTFTTLLTEVGFVGLRFYGAGRFPRLWKSMVFRAEKDG